jgi:hypothetical protein
LLYLIEEVAIGAGYEFDSPLLRVGDHFIDGRVKKGFAPIPEEDQKKVIAYFINYLFEEVKIHVSRWTTHAHGDRAKGAPEIAAGSGFDHDMGGPTPRMSRLEIDRGFNSKPVEKLPKWDVIKMVRDAITLETHLSSSQCFDSLIRSCHQMSEHARFLSFAFTRKISLSWFCWGRRHKRHRDPHLQNSPSKSPW